MSTGVAFAVRTGNGIAAAGFIITIALLCLASEQLCVPSPCNAVHIRNFGSSFPEHLVIIRCCTHVTCLSTTKPPNGTHHPLCAMRRVELITRPSEKPQLKRHSHTRLLAVSQ